MWRFIISFGPDKDQREPAISPEHTKPDDHISPFYTSPKTGNNHKREYQQHDGHESYKGINAIDPLQGFQQPLHQFLF